MRAFLRSIAAVLVAAVVGGSTWYFGWQYVFSPTYSCSVPEADRCENTASHTDWWALSGRPLSIDVRPAPAEWASSLDPQFVHAQWAAKVERFGQEPVLAACTYSSDEMVTCKAREEPFGAPSN